MIKSKRLCEQSRVLGEWGTILMATLRREGVSDSVTTHWREEINRSTKDRNQRRWYNFSYKREVRRRVHRGNLRYNFTVVAAPTLHSTLNIAYVDSLSIDVITPVFLAFLQHTQGLLYMHQVVSLLWQQQAHPTTSNWPSQHFCTPLHWGCTWQCGESSARHTPAIKNPQFGYIWTNGLPTQLLSQVWPTHPLLPMATLVTITKTVIYTP